MELTDCRNCNQLPALGNLESLESLIVYKMESLKHIGAEFYGVGGDTRFPKLQSLELEDMTEWEDWEIPFSKFKKVMPRLRDLKLKRCGKLMGLPALGRLESLEIIEMEQLNSLREVGSEFLGIPSFDGWDGGEYVKPQRVVFRRLTSLTIKRMRWWEEWNLPQQQVKNVEIMPCLSELKIVSCPKLKALPGALGQFPSLEELYLEDLDAVKHVGADLVRISDGANVAGATYGESSTSTSLSPNTVLFPKLTKLTLMFFPEWTEEGECEKTQEITKTASIMPNLQDLQIMWCPELKVLPPYMFPHSLRMLLLDDCPQLKVIPCLPPLLEKMTLGNDLGVVSTSLMSSICDHDYPNLKSVDISWSPHSSLPQGLSKLTSLQRLDIGFCEFLDLKPEDELRGFPTLQQLRIFECPVIRERCGREDWANTLSFHIAYNIEIGSNGGWIHFPKRR